MSKNNIGPKRLVVGAHYGLKEWMIQRVTAIVMVVFTIVLLITYLVNGNPSYDGWAGLFANQFMKLLTLLALLSLFLPCLDWGARYLDGLCKTGWYSFSAPSAHRIVACGLRCVCHSNLMESVRNDSH